MEKNTKLIVIIGSNGVGKSSAAKSFITRCPKSAFVDSDWCRVINPFHIKHKITKEDERIYFKDREFDQEAWDEVQRIRTR